MIKRPGVFAIDQQNLQNKIIDLGLQIREAYFQHYKEYEFLTWVWWLSIGFLVVPFIIWCLNVDKKRLLELCIFGLLTDIFATFLDVTGSEYILWDYSVHVLPQLPLLIPIDYVVLPVIGMLIYQKCPKWWPFLLVSTIAAAVMAFIMEPLAVAIKMYQLITWKYIYSFPIYIIIFAVAKLMVSILKKINQKANGKQDII